MAKKTVTAWIALGPGHEIYSVDASKEGLTGKLKLMFGVARYFFVRSIGAIDIKRGKITWEDK